MRIVANRIGLLAVAIAVLGCGGSIAGNGPMTGQGAQGGQAGQGGQGGQGGGTTTIPCSAMGACECLQSERCTPRSEACWCPGECFPGAAIDCICGGGRFVACEDNATVAACANELTAVHVKCADQAFIQYIGDLCTNAAYDPTCVAGCLANLKSRGSCSEIDCGLCPVCDCAPPVAASPFRACLQTCAQALPERL